MAYFEFPHTRTYDSDLGWIIRNLKEVIERLNGFIDVNNIKYSDPILWDITNSYAAFTITFTEDGTAYISKQAVPAGVEITNERFWLPLMQNVGEYNQNVYIFDTVADMLASDKLALGMYCKTRGFYTANDGGGAYYYIEETATPNEIDILTAGNFYAVLILGAKVDVKQLGAASDVEDCAAIFTRACDLANTYGKNMIVPEGDYYFKTPIQMYRNGLKINGGSYRNTRLIYNGNAIIGTDAFNAPFLINAFYNTIHYEYDFEITDLQFVTNSVVPAVLTVNGLAYSKIDHICVTPNADVKYGMWIGAIQQCIFNEFGTCPNMTGEYTAAIENGVFFTVGRRGDGSNAPVSTNNKITNMRGEQCTNGVFISYIDNSQFIDIAAETNTTRNLTIAASVRRCTFMGIGSEGAPSMYGLEISGEDCTIMGSYEITNTYLDGNRNTLIGVIFNTLNIRTNNHVIMDCEYSYSGGSLTFNPVTLGSVKITNLYNKTTESYYRQYNRTHLTLTDNIADNNCNVPLLCFTPTAITAGQISLRNAASGTGDVIILSSPFVVPVGGRIYSTRDDISYVPLNIA